MYRSYLVLFRGGWCWCWCWCLCLCWCWLLMLLSLGDCVLLIALLSVCVLLWLPLLGLEELDWIGLDLGWIGLDWIGLDWIGLDWVGLDWAGLDWVLVDRSDLVLVRCALLWFGLIRCCCILPIISISAVSSIFLDMIHVRVASRVVLTLPIREGSRLAPPIRRRQKRRRRSLTEPSEQSIAVPRPLPPSTARVLRSVAGSWCLAMCTCWAARAQIISIQRTKLSL